MSSLPSPEPAPARVAAGDLQGGRSGDPELCALGPWFHNLHLPDGRQTAPEHPLGDFPGHLWRELAPALPDDLEDWSVLDVGCNAGFYSFELARRGARVHAIDIDERFLRQAAWARERYGLQDAVRLEQRSAYRLHELPGEYDLVLFLGVLYHLRYPLLALDQVREKTRRLLLFQSLSLPGEDVAQTPTDLCFDDLPRLLRPGWPRVAFIEHALAADPTNWWVPDRAALEAMLRSSGFTDLQRLHTNSWLCSVGTSTSESAHARHRELAAALGRAPF